MFRACRPKIEHAACHKEIFLERKTDYALWIEASKRAVGPEETKMVEPLRLC